MAKRKYQRKNKNDISNKLALPKTSLDNDAKKSIYIILVFCFALLSLLGLFNFSGQFGNYISQLLTLAFGWGKIFFPLILLAWGYLLYRGKRNQIKFINYLGLFTFFISYQALLHIFIPEDSWQLAIDEGRGGGYLGMGLAELIKNAVGFWGGLVLLLALFLISLILILNTPLYKIIGTESPVAKVYSAVINFFKKLFSSNRTEAEIESEEFKKEQPIIDSGAADVQAISPTEAGLFFATKSIGENERFEPKKSSEPKKKEKIWKESNVKIDLPVSLLSDKIGKATSGDIKFNNLVIQKTLHNFGIDVEMGETSIGPTVTQYTFKPAEGVKLSRVTALSNDLSLALAAHPIRIEAPIPGKSLVGVEVPNKTKAIVGLKEILDADSFKTRNNNLMIALGKDVSGMPWLYNLNKMPHLLVAGATNSGKSVCLNAIIVSLLYQNNPDDLRFIMVDPKRVELPVYNGIPHLLTPVITDVKKTINALRWCLGEMDRRFEVLAKHNKRNIQAYNEYVLSNSKVEEGKMPYIVFVIDELADLMVAAARDIEGSVIRLAQMARAVGIHLILATQRPSVDVITGLIKANTPARIAFSVASGTDSKTILDMSGAEKLLGQGDMLLTTAELSKPKRLQGAFVSDEEIKNITNYIKERSGQANYLEGVVEHQRVAGIGGVGLEGNPSDEDDLLGEAKEIVVKMGKASASLLQRRLRIGYSRAASILDMLEEAGVIGPVNGSKPREILISSGEYEASEDQPTSAVSLHDRQKTSPKATYLGDDDEADGSGVVFKEEDEGGKEENENKPDPVREEPAAEEKKDGEDDEMFFAR